MEKETHLQLKLVLNVTSKLYFGKKAMTYFTPVNTNVSWRFYFFQTRTWHGNNGGQGMELHKQEESMM